MLRTFISKSIKGLAAAGVLAAAATVAQAAIGNDGNAKPIQPPAKAAAAPKVEEVPVKPSPVPTPSAQTAAPVSNASQIAPKAAPVKLVPKQPAPCCDKPCYPGYVRPCH